MADLTYSKRATQRRASTGLSPGKGDSHSAKVLASASIELVASASGTTVLLGRVPTTARLLPQRFIYNDDLATSGSPTLDIGLASVGSNVTSDPDAIHNGLALSSATTTTTIMSDPANAGKQLWEFVSGQTTDPGGELDIYASVKDAATTATGTVTIELLGYFD